jgi:hypothetical protein
MPLPFFEIAKFMTKYNLLFHKTLTAFLRRKQCCATLIETIFAPTALWSVSSSASDNYRNIENEPMSISKIEDLCSLDHQR